MAWVDPIKWNDGGLQAGVRLGHRWLAALQEFRYGLAAVLLLIALALTLLLNHVEPGRPTLFIFFAAIAVSAWHGGIGAGVFAAALSAPAGLYFYATSVETSITQNQIGLGELFLLVCFSLCAIVGNLLNTWQNAARESLRSAHQRLQQKAQQLQHANDALLREMSERRLAEAALQEARAQLARVSCLTTMGELATSIAHEVNQPLTAIAANAGSCLNWLERANVQEAQKAANRIIGNANHASGVIARIRRMLKPENTKRQIHINRAIENVLSLIQHDIHKQRITVQTELAPELPTFMGDQVQLQQVFLNLFLNAIEAMSSVDSRERVLRIHSHLISGRIVVSIRDTGPGITPEIADRLFDAFVTTKASGMGLGLAVCRSVIESHAGTLTVAPGTPAGAVFEMCLPYQSGRP